MSKYVYISQFECTEAFSSAVKLIHNMRNTYTSFSWKIDCYGDAIDNHVLENVTDAQLTALINSRGFFNLQVINGKDYIKIRRVRVQ